MILDKNNLSLHLPNEWSASIRYLQVFQGDFYICLIRVRDLPNTSTFEFQEEVLTVFKKRYCRKNPLYTNIFI